MAWNALTALILTVFFALHHNFTIFFCIKFATFNVADFPVSYQITSVTLMVMGNFKNLCVFNFAILLKLRKFDASKIYTFYSIRPILVTLGQTFKNIFSHNFNVYQTFY